MLQCGRGSKTAERPGCASAAVSEHWSGFNVAAVLRPRKAATAAKTRRPRCSFNVAAVLRPRKAVRRLVIHGRSECFNVAAVLRPRKVAYSDVFEVVFAPGLQCGRGSKTAESISHEHTWAAGTSFNVAAVLRPRKARRTRRCFLRGLVRLQCGRGSKTAERPHAPTHLRDRFLLLQCGRGSKTAERGGLRCNIAASRAGFNVAAVLRPRKGTSQCEQARMAH